MPSNIVNLNEVVPGIDGTTFMFTPPGGKEQSYHVPGDLASETVFELLALFEETIAFQVETSKMMASKVTPATVKKLRADVQSLTAKLDAKLLEIFQIAQPDLEKLPFGAETRKYVLGEIFEMVGLASKDPAGPLPDPPTKPKARSGATRKPQTRRKKK